jgi:DNA processing protein
MPAEVHDEYRAALALRHTPGLGPRTWKRLLAHFPSLTEAAARAGEWQALDLASERQVCAFRSRAWKEPAEAEYRRAREAAVRVLVATDARYPPRLREIADPPLFLYCLGRVSLLSAPALAIVGARRSSAYGLAVAKAIGEELSRAGLAIVSGLAQGIDREAHLAGLSGLGGSVAVLGTGPDLVYPEANRDVWQALAANGAIVTEYPPGTRPEHHHFPIRNRIISGLSLGVLVAEATEKSGSLITARLAMEQGREVFAAPGPVNTASHNGCHELIRDGATLVGSAADILRELSSLLAGFALPETGGRQSADRPAPAAPVASGAPEPADLSSEEAALLAALPSGDKVHMDDIGRTLGLSPGAVSGRLLGLELKGLVRQWPGMYYSRS